MTLSFIFSAIHTPAQDSLNRAYYYTTTFGINKCNNIRWDNCNKLNSVFVSRLL